MKSKSTKSAVVLLADIGGTKTRLTFGTILGGLGQIKSFRNDDLSSFVDLLEQEIARQPKSVKSAVLAVAAPIDGDTIQLINRNWKFSQQQLKQRLNLQRLIVINDFVAVAHATRAFKKKDVLRIGGVARRDGARLACGPGTGFGVSALIEDGKRVIAIPSDGGHAVLSLACEDEYRIFEALKKQNTAPTIEDLLCAQGLERLHCGLFDRTLGSDEIVSAARTGEKDALRSIELFQRVLGRVVRDLVLTFDAKGGAYIAGGVGRGLARLIGPTFRESFEQHTHSYYADRLKRIPTYFVLHPTPGLLGALKILEQDRF